MNFENKISLKDSNKYINVCASNLGTKAIRCTDESFAAKERMLSETEPIFKNNVYDNYGQWMDGWETKRRRTAGFDWCIIRLGVPSCIEYFQIDTAYFTGNYPLQASVWGSTKKREPSDNEKDWEIISNITDLGPSQITNFECTKKDVWRWLRLNIYPDGGIARFKAFGYVKPDWPLNKNDIETSNLIYGGKIISFSDAHYGNINSIITKGNPVNMGDGWETRRRRSPGYDWIIIKLGTATKINKILVDTTFFKGNSPSFISLQAEKIDAKENVNVEPQAIYWPKILKKQIINPDSVHIFENDLYEFEKIVNYVKLNIYPDGGISRFRIFGKINDSY